MGREQGIGRIRIAGEATQLLTGARGDAFKATMLETAAARGEASAAAVRAFERVVDAGGAADATALSADVKDAQTRVAEAREQAQKSRHALAPLQAERDLLTEKNLTLRDQLGKSENDRHRQVSELQQQLSSGSSSKSSCPATEQQQTSRKPPAEQQNSSSESSSTTAARPAEEQQESSNSGT